MFSNAFSTLQKMGKSLMIPVAVLPVTGILFGIGMDVHAFGRLGEKGSCIFTWYVYRFACVWRGSKTLPY